MDRSKNLSENKNSNFPKKESYQVKIPPQFQNNTNAHNEISLSNIESSINSSSKPSFHYFIPWKRAEADPSLVRRGTEIHVNPLPPTITHEELYGIFKSYGEIIDLRVIPRKDKGNCFAFIRFMEQSSVDRVLKDTCFIQGKEVRIQRSKEESTLFLGNIKKNWSKSYMENALADINLSYDELRFFQDPQNPEKNRGYCFVRINNPVKAREAYEKMTKNIIIEGTPITVDWADEFSDHDINRVQLHISGIDENMSSDNIYTIFSQFGDVINIKLSRDQEKGRKDYGFVTFSNEDEAAKALANFKWREYFTKPVYIQYARKISSIIKHKQKIQGDMLERKRRRDNILKNEKRYRGSESDEESEEERRPIPIKKGTDEIINEFSKIINNLNNSGTNNPNISDLMTQMMNHIASNMKKDEKN